MDGIKRIEQNKAFSDIEKAERKKAGRKRQLSRIFYFSDIYFPDNFSFILQFCL